jgi:2-(1,2-epoxy-1,2-dihydrophenyl)acetyl-CoA isomerase
VSRLVLTEQHNSIVILTLNRQERHNSLVPELLEELLAALQVVGADPDARVVVLQANGRSFSTGGDVLGFYEHMEGLEAYAHTIVGLLNRVILALIKLPLPVVAAVHGIVTGGSLGLVLGSDVVLIAPETSFMPYYSVVGFSPDGGWTALLPNTIGPKRAGEILIRNQTITAEQAVAWGLASHIIPAERIRAEALSVARDIAAKKLASIGHAKHLLRASYGDLAARLEAERVHFVQQITTREARQGILAFLEGRRA